MKFLEGEIPIMQVVVVASGRGSGGRGTYNKMSQNYKNIKKK